MTTTPAGPRADGLVPGTNGYRRVLAGVMFGGLANFALLYYVQPLLPELAERYGVSPSQSAGALSVSTLALAVGLLAVGPLADRFGRITVMRWSLLVSGLVGIASGFAPTWETLMVLRAVDGVALAGLPAVALAYIREEIHTDHHSRANAAYITGTALGGAVGRLLPGPLALIGGWPLATASMGVLTLAAAVVVWTVLPPSASAARDVPGGMRRAFGTLLALRDPVIALLCAAGFALMGVFVGIYNAVAFRLTEAPLNLGDSVVLVYAAYLIGVPAPLAMGRLSRRFGRGATIGTGVAVLASGIGLLAMPTLPTVVVGLGCVTFAFLGTHSLFSGWSVERAHRRRVSTASAASAYLLAYYLGSAVVGVVAVRLWQAFGWGGVTLAALSLASVVACAAATATVLDRRARRRPPRGKRERGPSARA